MRPLFVRSLSLAVLPLMLAFAAVANSALIGCARTNLRTPEGLEYASDKDITLDGFHLRKEYYPDGKPKLVDLEINKGGGNASQVNAANWQGFNSALQQGIQIGASIARAAAGLPTLPATVPITPVAQPPPAEPADPTNPQ